MKKFVAFILAAFLLVSCAKKIETTSENAPPKKPGYHLKFPSDFKVGMNSVDDFGISVAIIMDVSGSMSNAPKGGGDKKYIQANNALKTVTNFLIQMAEKQKDLKIQVSILRFSSGVELVLPLTVLNSDGISKLKASTNIKFFEPDGGTAIGEAVEKGASILAQSGTILNSLIVISDGENTGSLTPDVALDALYDNRNTASTADYEVRTSSQMVSFVGFDVSSGIFDNVKKKGARVASATNQVELEQSLTSLLEADITKLESK